MFDTNLVIVGNVLVAPQWRRVDRNGVLVAHFRVASTARRYDRESKSWVDGNNLRVRVTAWRRLAEGVASSLTVGDPVIIYGRLYTRDWKDDKGNNRISYEMVASSIGHDLARGRARFYRTKATQEAGMIDEADEEVFVGGEASMPLATEEVPVTYGDGVPDGEEPDFLEVVAGLDDPPMPPEQGDSAAPPEGNRRSRRSSKREPVAA
ncbi:single-stranded DNA-binding protein [Actinoplanes sp. TBRC 11911]|uniref:single-stranded DNA-binding protein n=1 Tax=Actinoplanes sp. TBRC 11911 TaxID=2729386 RepID=UPI00145C84ED|nr:single-stranded DNA-binding protein [Actinoplanes sp. TBRC 11911]NMO55602.1 single-stranded DNA-binding protein [Actinoplanes sp. TBRC 11911]